VSLKSETDPMPLWVPRIAPFFGSEMLRERPQGASVQALLCSINKHSSWALWECGNRVVGDFQGAVGTVENLLFGFPPFP
jgi:hypothetical protein